MNLGITSLQGSRRSVRPMRLASEFINAALTKVAMPAQVEVGGLRSMVRDHAMSKSHVETLGSHNGIKARVRQSD